MTVDRYGIHLGALFIHFYGLLIMVGVLAAAFLSYRRAKAKGMEADRIWDLVTWALIGGVIGARLWHILTPPPSMVEQGITFYYYITHPLDALAIWRGGLGIPGAVAGGGLAVWIFTRKNKQSFAAWVDVIAPGLIMAQAIGRWGNFVNQELYGAPTSLPWGIYIDEAHRLPQFMQYSYYHPLFFYEFLWNLFIMVVLLWLDKKLAGWMKTGDLFLFYLIGYPFGRFMLEFLRLDSSQVGGLNVNQTLMGVIAILSISFLIYRHRFQKGNELRPDEAVANTDGMEEKVD
jgi:phosphatidylglycerol---prolipoprotein diacylglyceryl transferase